MDGQEYISHSKLQADAAKLDLRYDYYLETLNYFSRSLVTSWISLSVYNHFNAIYFHSLFNHNIKPESYDLGPCFLYMSE